MGKNDPPLRRLFRLAGCVFLFAAFPGFSQTAGDERPETQEAVNEALFFIRENEGLPEIIQRFTWPRDDNAYRYEVIIEEQNGKDFREVHRESTQNAFMEVSLRPGKYRYRVQVYNLFDQHEYTTNWASFDILPALQPVIGRFSPACFFVDDFVWEIELEGENFTEGASVYLESLYTDETIVPQRYIPHASGTGARLVFDPQDLRIGDYRIVIKNPGGLSNVSSGEPFLIREISWQRIALSLSWAPLVPLHGYLFDLFDGFSAAGLSVRADTVFHKISWGYLGAGLNLSWNYLSAQKNDINSTGHLGSLELNVFFRKKLSRMFFTVYAGAGLGGILLLEFDYGVVKSDPINSIMPLASTGFSLQWYFTNKVFADLGVKYIYLFSKESPRNGYLRPSFGFGWRF
jgi:hypothetical protein